MVGRWSPRVLVIGGACLDLEARAAVNAGMSAPPLRSLVSSGLVNVAIGKICGEQAAPTNVNRVWRSQTNVENRLIHINPSSEQLA
jgi:hypothetical protein